jgi:restriction system protein
MSNISSRRAGELQRGVFKILLDHPEGLPAKEIIGRMSQIVPPTDFEKSDYPKHPGIQRYGKMIRFATIGPVKAGWLIKEKGRWYFTEEGKKAYINFEDPEKFRRESSRLYYQWLDKQPKESSEAADEFQADIGTSERIADATSTLEEAEETAWNEIEEYMAAINPYDLQRMSPRCFVRWGITWFGYRLPGPTKE